MHKNNGGFTSDTVVPRNTTTRTTIYNNIIIYFMLSSSTTTRRSVEASVLLYRRHSFFEKSKNSKKCIITYSYGTRYVQCRPHKQPNETSRSPINQWHFIGHICDVIIRLAAITTSGRSRDLFRHFATGIAVLLWRQWLSLSLSFSQNISLAALVVLLSFRSYWPSLHPPFDDNTTTKSFSLTIARLIVS